MRIGRNGGVLVLACGLLLGGAGTALAHDCDHGRHGYRTQSNHRLYRHRSGYLYPPERHFGGVHFLDPYAGGGSDCRDTLPDDRVDFDNRRDRLLEAATRIDVSYVGSPGTAEPSSRTTRGWALLREGDAVGALGRFTGRILVVPSDAQARLGFALAAALIGDDAAASRSMRAAVGADPNVLAAVESDVLRDHLRGCLERYEREAETAPELHPQFMIAALRCLLGAPEEARDALAAIGPALRDQPVVRALTKGVERLVADSAPAGDDAPGGGEPALVARRE